jgi:hypothetical protein
MKAVQIFAAVSKSWNDLMGLSSRKSGLVAVAITLARSLGESLFAGAVLAHLADPLAMDLFACAESISPQPPAAHMFLLDLHHQQ